MARSLIAVDLCSLGVGQWTLQRRCEKGPPLKTGVAGRKGGPMGHGPGPWVSQRFSSPAPRMATPLPAASVIPAPWRQCPGAPRGWAVPPAPSSRARLAPPPAPPGRAVLGPLPGTSSAGAGLPPLTRPHDANPKLRLQGRPCAGGPGRGPHAPLPRICGRGCAALGARGWGVAGTGAAQGPRVPRPQLQSSPGRLPALSPGSQAEGPLRPTLPRTFLASVLNGPGDPGPLVTRMTPDRASQGRGGGLGQRAGTEEGPRAHLRPLCGQL